MPNTSATQSPQSPKFDRIGSSTAEDWAISGYANAARAGGAARSGQGDYRSGLPSIKSQLTAAIAKHRLGANDWEGPGWTQMLRAKAFNAIIVGGSLDQDTSARTDDYMWTKSSHINLSTQYGPGGAYYTDWELPNIVAPARATESVCLNIDGYDACVQDYGTSFSSAQVAGIVAQIHQANNWLRTWPETVRSILMCSANRDLAVGRLSLTDSTDDRDGAGEANATLAVQMANVSNRLSPGSAATARGMDYTIVFQADHAENTSMPAYAAQTSASGKRLRAVLTWDASTTCTNVSNPSTVACNPSSLDADLDLWVKRHDNGQIVGYSNTYVGSYEFVEFAAEANVQYDIVIKFGKWWNASTYYAISWNFDDYTSAD